MQTTKPHRLLIVDDEPVLRELLSFEFELQGYEVATAAGGFEAWSLLQSRSFDGILSDVRMPEGDGFWLLRKLKEQNVNTPVILMTGFMEVHEGSDEKTKELLKGRPIVAKPFELEHLTRTVLQAIHSNSDSDSQEIQKAAI